MKNVLMTGQFADAKIVMIENLQINLDMGNAANGNGVTIEKRIKAM